MVPFGFCQLTHTVENIHISLTFLDIAPPSKIRGIYCAAPSTWRTVWFWIPQQKLKIHQILACFTIINFSHAGPLLGRCLKCFGMCILNRKKGFSAHFSNISGHRPPSKSEGFTARPPARGELFGFARKFHFFTSVISIIFIPAPPFNIAVSGPRGRRRPAHSIRE